MTTGEILAKLRIEKNVGQKELATYLRVSVGTVSNYENDVHSPDLTTLSRLADYFEVTTDWDGPNTALTLNYWTSMSPGNILLPIL